MNQSIQVFTQIYTKYFELICWKSPPTSLEDDNFFHSWFLRKIVVFSESVGPFGILGFIPLDEQSPFSTFSFCKLSFTEIFSIRSALSTVTRLWVWGVSTCKCSFRILLNHTGIDLSWYNFNRYWCRTCSFFWSFTVYKGGRQSITKNGPFHEHLSFFDWPILVEESRT